MEYLKQDLALVKDKLDKTSESTALLHQSTLQMEESNNRMIASVEGLVREVATLVEQMRGVRKVEAKLETEKTIRVENSKQLALLAQRQDRTDKFIYGGITAILGTVGYMLLQAAGIK